MRCCCRTAGSVGLRGREAPADTQGGGPAASLSPNLVLQSARPPPPTAARASLADFHGLLIVGAEEVVGAVLLHGLPAVLAHVEHWMEKKGPLADHADHQKGLPRSGSLFPEKKSKPAHDLNKIPIRPGNQTVGSVSCASIAWPARLPSSPKPRTVFLQGCLPWPSLQAGLSRPGLEPEPESRWQPQA